MSQRIETLIGEIERLADADTRRRAQELVAAVLELHQAGLRRMLELAAGTPALVEELAADPKVASLLLLHDLHPSPLAERVERACAALAPLLAREGAALELSSHGASFSVRLSTTAGAELAALDRLAALVEQTLADAAPDAAAIRVERPAAPETLVKLRVPSRDAGRGLESEP